jgi:hypothetical protein
MSTARQADPELDTLIDEITVDCHDEDEQLTGSRPPSTTTATSHAPAPSSAKKSRSPTSVRATAVVN